MKRSIKLALTAIAVTTAMAAGGAAAGGVVAPAASTQPPLAQGLVGPLAFDMDSAGNAIVGQSFIGQVTAVSRNGEVAPVFSSSGAAVGGVARGRGGLVYVTERTDQGGPGTPVTLSTLSQVRAGRVKPLADILAFETAANPDQANTYGIPVISDACAAQLPGPATYTGGVDTNAYALATQGNTIYIADAGANAVFASNLQGDLRTVAVLPPQPAIITPALAGALGLPDCAIGLTYNFEPVPTDVEIGPGGVLYVTTLPGGPENPSAGARGALWTIDPRTGAATLVAGGLAGATDLALGRGGTVFVTELYANRVSRISGGTVTPLIDLPAPVAAEFAGGRLYVTYNAFGNGTLAQIKLP